MRLNIFLFFLLAISVILNVMMWTEKDDAILVEFDSPKGHVEVELEIRPLLVNGPDPYVNQNKPNVILIEPKTEGKQQVLVRIRPVVITKQKS